MQYENTFKAIDQILWKESGCSSELDYLEQKSWLLFLKYLDDLETRLSLKASSTSASSRASTAGHNGLPLRLPTAR